MDQPIVGSYLLNFRNVNDIIKLCILSPLLFTSSVWCHCLPIHINAQTEVHLFVCMRLSIYAHWMRNMNVAAESESRLNVSMKMYKSLKIPIIIFWNNAVSRDTPTDVRLKLRFRFELDTINCVTEICECICTDIVEVENSFPRRAHPLECLHFLSHEYLFHFIDSDYYITGDLFALHWSTHST